jgi:hypothetical protein
MFRILKDRKVFFSEEKKQKTFDCAVADSPEAYATAKSFLVLFFKKEHFLP